MVARFMCKTGWGSAMMGLGYLEPVPLLLICGKVRVEVNRKGRILNQTCESCHPVEYGTDSTRRRRGGRGAQNS